MMFHTDFKEKHVRELARHFRNYNYERDDNGGVIIGAHARIAGLYETTTPDGVVTRTPNLWTTEGLNYLLSAALANGTRYSAFYIAPFSGNVTLADTLTAATFASTVTELTTQYTNATRLEFVEAVPANKNINNNANPQIITTAVDSVTIWGLGLLSSSTKGSTSGVLASAAKYASAQSIPTAGGQLSVTYNATLSNI